MEQRMNMQQAAPAIYGAVLRLEQTLSQTQLSATHRNLIKIRASQINGCAYCLNLHTKEARAAGEKEKRIYLLDAWRETDLYNEEERAILALTESVTLIQTHVPDDIYQTCTRLFDRQYLALIIMNIVTINIWNRIAITTRTPLA